MVLSHIYKYKEPLKDTWGKKKCVGDRQKDGEREEALTVGLALLSEEWIMPLAMQMIRPLQLSQVFNSPPKGMWLIVRWAETWREGFFSLSLPSPLLFHSTGITKEVLWALTKSFYESTYWSW